MIFSNMRTLLGNYFVMYPPRFRGFPAGYLLVCGLLCLTGCNNNSFRIRREVDVEALAKTWPPYQAPVLADAGVNGQPATAGCIS